MGRTRLRGVELAGLGLAVESSSDFVWDWPEGRLDRARCVLADPDIYVGVSVGQIQPPTWDPITYSFEGGTFDVARVRDEWWVGVHSQGRRFERLARFNLDVSEGEVILASGIEQGLKHPLEGPLLDWLITHGIIQGGGLILAGSAILDPGGALAVLSHGPHDVGCPMEGANWNGMAPIVTPGPRFAVRVAEDHVRVHSLPNSVGEVNPGQSRRLKAIHILVEASEPQMDSLAADEAVDAVVSRACAPIHAPELTDKVLMASSRLVSRVPVTRLGLPQARLSACFDWNHPEAAFGLVTPQAV